MARQKSTHVDDPVAVGRRLRQAREKRGMSQRALAFAGCSAGYISRIEAGERIPSLQLLRELGQRLGVSAEYLATGSEEVERDLLAEAELALRVDEIELAEHLFAQARDEAHDPVARGRALAGLGQLVYRDGDIEGAIVLLAEAEQLVESVVDYPAIVVTLGNAYDMQGEHESALAIFERALAEANQRDDEIAARRFAVLLANSLIDSGNLGRAEELLGQVIAASESSADPLSLARIYWSQSRLHVAQGRFDLAARFARQAIALLEAGENSHYLARAHHLLAYIELERGNAAEALVLLRQGLPLIERGGDQSELALFRLEEARALVKLGQLEEARQVATEVLGSLEGMSQVDQARAYSTLAEIFAESGDRLQAIELYESSLEQMDGSPFALDTYRKLAELLEAEGRPDEALAVLKRAVEPQTAKQRPN
jgi:tetratricopeptide (TPR) repeat protein